MEGTQLKELGCGCLVHFVINANYMSLFSMELEKLIVSVYKQQKWTLKNCSANKFPKTTINCSLLQSSSSSSTPACKESNVSQPRTNGFCYRASEFCFLTCPTGRWYFLSNLNNRRTVKSILLVKKLLGLVEMTSGLVNASFSLPEWQAVKMIFLAPWSIHDSFVFAMLFIPSFNVLSCYFYD